MEIIEIKENKKQYMELLLEADPDKEVIEKYIENSDMYVLINDNVVVSEVVIVKLNDDEYELKNIATLPEARGNGYARQLIKYVFEKYRNICRRMIVGTTENMIPFYVMNGFNKYHHTVKNFFVDNYSEEVWDGELHCIDMYYYAKEFKKVDYELKEISSENREEVNQILITEWEATDIIIRGKVVDGTKVPGVIAYKDNKIIGLITYIIENNECEIVSLNSYIENKGIGTALIENVKEIAIKEKCNRLKLVTTNDNIRGIEFYQRRGFIFSALYKDAIEISRKLKPEIPMYADNGLPIRDEIEFEMYLN